MPIPVTYFKRNPLLSFRILPPLIIILVFGILCFDTVRKGAQFSAVYITLYVIAILGVMLYLGKNMHYFGVSDKALLIRNSIFPWQYREILFSDIKSIRIDMNTFGWNSVWGSRWGEPYYLMIFLKGSGKEMFYGSTLNAKQWALLTIELEKYNVRVINMCPYVPFRDLL